ncbi:MAG: helix-turn-helix domain-containing protein [Candidatus Brocadiia bacterium]
MEQILANVTDQELEMLFHRLRWSEGIRCPHCNRPQQKIYRHKRTNRLSYFCLQCKIRFGDTVGTILEGTHLSLRQWLLAIHMYLVNNDSAADVARELKVNRHTAESIRELIRKEELWCRMILQGITDNTRQAVIAPLMILGEVERYLGVSRRTIYRLVDAGALSAVKVGRQWRFKPDEVQKYVTHKLNRYGTGAITENYFFGLEVLNKYKTDKAKYYIEDEAYQGWVGNRDDFNYMQKVSAFLGRGARQVAGLARIVFYHLHYKKVVTPEGHPALAIHHKDYESLPPEEYVHWSNYQIWDSKSSR